MNPALALLLFHSRVGVRLALRLLAPVFAGLFAFYYLLRPEFLILLARQVFGKSAPLAQGGVVAAILLLAARSAAPRVSHGLGGWLRHLPTSGTIERRTAALAIWLAQVPLLLVLAGLSVVGTMDMTGLIFAGTSAYLTLTGLILAGAAASMTAVPSTRTIARRVFGIPAAVFAGSGRPVFLAAAAVLLLVLDRVSGGVAPARSAPKRWPTPPALFWSGLNLRALGWLILAGPAAASIPAVATRIFLANNILPETVIPAAVRFGSALSLVACLSLSAGLLAARRPPWPWSRSLPRTASRSVLSDAAFLAGPALVALVPYFFLDPGAAIASLSFLAAMALRASGAIRTASESRYGLSGTLAIEGAVAAAAFGLWSLTTFLLPAALPFLLSDGARREKTLKATRWAELHHAAAGDSLSWSGR